MAATVSFIPFKIIAAPSEAYPSIEGAVATIIYGIFSKNDTYLHKSWITPEPTPTIKSMPWSSDLTVSIASSFGIRTGVPSNMTFFAALPQRAFSTFSPAAANVFLSATIRMLLCFAQSFVIFEIAPFSIYTYSMLQWCVLPQEQVTPCKILLISINTPPEFYISLCLYYNITAKTSQRFLC